MVQYSNLKIHNDTYERLRKAKRRGETYDLLISRMLDKMDGGD